jgi:MOSC domain-containing protein YiiM
VLSIHLRPAKGQPPRAVQEARALVGHGLEGDFHGKHRAGSSRQVLLVDQRTLEALGFGHGALREQLTVDFADLDGLPAGTRLTVGEAVLEVTGACEPCEVIGKINGVADPYTLRDTLVGRRGVLAKVVDVAAEGRIRSGDSIAVMTAREGQAGIPAEPAVEPPAARS